MDNVAFGVQFDQKESKQWGDFNGLLSLGLAYSGLKKTKLGIENKINTEEP